MNSDTAKIRLKVGALEVEYEGQASFLKSELHALMEQLVRLCTHHEVKLSTEPKLPKPIGKNQIAGQGHSTNTIATHLGAASGPELAIAAAAHLTFFTGKDSFTRSEIHNEMKAAVTYYKASMSGNLSKILGTLVENKRLNYLRTNTYALSAAERTVLEPKLAEI